MISFKSPTENKSRTCPITRSVISSKVDFSGERDSNTIYCSIKELSTLLYSIGDSKSTEAVSI